MPPLANGIVLGCFAAYVLILVVEAALGHSFGLRTGLQFIGLLAAASAVHWVTGFPVPRQAFGSDVAIWQLLLTLLCVVLGIVANGMYYHRGESWTSIVKPLLLSPMVVIPLLVIINSDANARDSAVFYGVAFQNGFFWRAVLKNAKAKTIKG